MSEQPIPVDGISESQEQKYYRLYLKVFVALCVCTALSFVFNFALGHGKISATLISVVAIIKAALVIAIFMHLMFDWRKVAAIMIPVLIMCVMTIIILSIDGAIVWHEYQNPDRIPLP